QNIEALKFWAGLWKFSPPGQAEYSLIDVPTVMGNGIAAQAIAWSDFVLGIDRPGASKLAGKFTYKAIPRNASYQGPPSADGEPSLIAIPKGSKNPEAAYLFLQWMVDKSTQHKLIEALHGGVPIRNSSWSEPAIAQGPLAGLFVAMHESISHGAA